MRKLGSIAATTFTLLAVTGGAVAGGPPLVNETVHSVDDTLTDIGVNCATGNMSQRSVTFSGVMRTTPVKTSAGPICVGREPLRRICMFDLR